MIMIQDIGIWYQVRTQQGEIESLEPNYVDMSSGLG